MKKVKFLINTLSNGGAERVVSNLSLNLNNKINKEILLFGKNSKAKYSYNGKLTFLDKIEHKNIFYKIYALVKRIIKLKNIKKNNNKSTIISFLEYPNLINLLTIKYGKTIVSVRNHMSTKHNKGFKSYFWNNTIKYLYNKADLIVVVSKEIKRDLIDNYGINKNNIKVIYNSYSIKKIKKLANKSLKHKYKKIFKDPVIITMGRLNKQKGHCHLIRSFTKVKKSIPNAKLVILGKGKQKNYLDQLVSDFNLKKDVYFLGFKKNPFKYIAKSKIFVLSSLYEGFPNSLSEAMACEVPVLSTDCLSGPRELLAPDEFDKKNITYGINKNRYGILVPNFDGIQKNHLESLNKEEEKMAENIINFLENEKLEKYFSKQSLKRIKNFDINKFIKKWEKII